MFIYNCKNYVLFKRVLFEYIDIITNIVFINIWSLDFIIGDVREHFLMKIKT